MDLFRCSQERQTFTTSTASNERVIAIDYFRGLAALMVAWFHLTSQYDGSWVKASGSFGWLGVEVFFVISGFIIPYSMVRAHASGLVGYGQFIGKRAIRVELPYLVSILAAVILWHASSLAPGFAGSAPDWSVEQLILHIAYLIPFSEMHWLQPVYWTLAYEFAFYVFIGCVFSSVVVHRKAWRFCALSLLISTLIVFEFMAFYFGLFVMGCVAFRLMARRERLFPSVLMVAVTFACMAAAGGGVEGGVGVITTLLIVRSAKSELQGRIGLVLASLGTISYSLYLIHVLIGGRVVNLGRRLAETDLQFFALSISALAISIFAAWMFWRWVEQPSQRIARQMFSRPERIPRSFASAP